MSIKNIFILFLLSYFLISCGIYRPTDSREVSTNAKERVKKNIEEGRGFRLSTLGKNNNGNFLFASSNPLWRASMEKLSFAPLSVVDYSGGVIITEWFNFDTADEEEIKIAVRFLTNEIRSDAINVTIHKRKCVSFNKCQIDEINNSTNSEIKLAILKKAAQIQSQEISEKAKEDGEYIMPEKL